MPDIRKRQSFWRQDWERMGRAAQCAIGFQPMIFPINRQDATG